MSSRKAKGRTTTKKRAQRATSNVFAMFDQAQIQEFKEAFNMIDQNRDGFIDKEDLHDMLASLGKNPTDPYLEDMMNEAPGPINFTMFLTLFGERLQGTDPEEVIKNAFGCFDEENTGFLNEERLRELLISMGDRFSDEDVRFLSMKCIAKRRLKEECSITSSLHVFLSTELRIRTIPIFNNSIDLIIILYLFQFVFENGQMVKPRGNHGNSCHSLPAPFLNPRIERPRSIHIHSHFLILHLAIESLERELKTLQENIQLLDDDHRAAVELPSRCFRACDIRIHSDSTPFKMDDNMELV
uniref:EF-hand domain-containing protein n=1 Tax=Strigamia maritima TaxID=126957 RepID=T1J436_STRMM